MQAPSSTTAEAERSAANIQPFPFFPPVLSGLETVSVDGLAKILGRSPATIKTQMSRQPDRVPPAFPGSWPTMWRLITVLEWMDKIEGRATTRPNPLLTAQEPQQPKRGRPRNTTTAKPISAISDPTPTEKKAGGGHANPLFGQRLF